MDGSLTATLEDTMLTMHARIQTHGQEEPDTVEFNVDPADEMSFFTASWAIQAMDYKEIWLTKAGVGKVFHYDTERAYGGFCLMEEEFLKHRV
jgi:hypothetical protein